MERVTADDARRHFRDLLDAAMRGEKVVITRNGKPVAVLGPVTRRWLTVGEAKDSSEEERDG